MQEISSRVSVLGELFRFLWARKLWWIIPMIIALVGLILLIILGSTGVLSPFIYSLF